MFWSEGGMYRFSSILVNPSSSSNNELCKLVSQRKIIDSNRIVKSLGFHSRSWRNIRRDNILFFNENFDPGDIRGDGIIHLYSSAHLPVSREICTIGEIESEHLLKNSVIFHTICWVRDWPIQYSIYFSFLKKSPGFRDKPNNVE